MLNWTSIIDFTPSRKIFYIQQYYSNICLCLKCSCRQSTLNMKHFVMAGPATAFLEMTQKPIFFALPCFTSLDMMKVLRVPSGKFCCHIWMILVEKSTPLLQLFSIVIQYSQICSFHSSLLLNLECFATAEIWI